MHGPYVCELLHATVRGRHMENDVDGSGRRRSMAVWRRSENLRRHGAPAWLLVNAAGEQLIKTA